MNSLTIARVETPSKEDFQGMILDNGPSTSLHAIRTKYPWSNKGSKRCEHSVPYTSLSTDTK